MHCTFCPRELRDDARFCDQCGRSVPRGGGGTEAEHRWVTLMFCDLVGSAALSDQLAREDMRKVLGAYQGACKAVIERHDRLIGRFVGDGLLVYFGYPESQEDDAQRAVRAALGIVAAVGALMVEVGGRRLLLQVRIGIETGPVLIGDIDASAALERDAAVGSVPNVAARLQALARPDGIVVGAVTHGRLGDGFECGPPREVSLKGIARPLQVYEVLAEKEAVALPAWRLARALSPLVERDAPRDRLRAAWQAARRAQPGVVCVSGEAGVGKSRLVRALLEDLEGENFTQVIYRCAPQHQGSPLHPAAVQLQQALGLDPKAGDEDRRLTLKEGLQGLGLAPREVTALGLLAGVPPDPLEVATAPSPTDVRREMLDALAALLAARARQAPTLMVVEDLHWCDPSTEEFLATLCARTLPGRLLLVLTHRPHVQPAWAAHVAPQSIVLDRLSRDASRTVVQALLSGRAVPERVVDRVLDRAEGIPLFLEEFASLLAEADGTAASPAGQGFAHVAIPDSLQASLAARLGHIGPARRVAQVAAALGRTFSRAQLLALSDPAALDIDAALSELARKGLLGAALGATGPGGDEHEFAHALIRDAAYQSMPREDRHAVHLRIAECLEADFPATAAARPELVAHHYTEAKAHRRAVDWWYLAGQKAMGRQANVETIEHLRRGLGLLDAVDATERPLLELRYQTALMPALCATRGYANLEVEQAFSRAHELCKQLGAIPSLSAVLYGLWSYYLVRADLVRSRQLALEMKHIAEQTGDALQQMESELAAGLTSLYEGDLTSAGARFQRILALWTPEGPQFFTAGEDIRASTKSWLGLVHWHQGDVDRAKEVAQESLYRARQVGQPISLAFALYFNVFLAHFCRDVPRLQALAEEGRQLCEEKKLFWGALCVLHLGWAATQGAAGGDLRAGTERMARGLGEFRAGGARLTQTYYLAMIAQAQLAAGALEDSERHLTEAFAAAGETGEQLWRSELLRLRGALMLRLRADAPAGATSTAEGLMREALAYAGSIGARSLALRAATTLAQLLGQDGRSEEAVQLLEAALAPIRCVGVTPDIVEARALQAALRQRAGPADG